MSVISPDVCGITKATVPDSIWPDFVKFKVGWSLPTVKISMIFAIGSFGASVVGSAEVQAERMRVVTRVMRVMVILDFFMIYLVNGTLRLCD